MTSRHIFIQYLNQFLTALAQNLHEVGLFFVTIAMRGNNPMF